MIPMLPLDSTDVFMEECADMLRLVLDCPKSPKKNFVNVGQSTSTTISADFR